jgi:twitching motility protein PilT
MARLDRHLEQLLAARGSDLHLSAGRAPIIRVHGELRPIPGEGQLTAERLTELLAEVLPEPDQNKAAIGHDLDFAYALDTRARFRVNVFRQQRGSGAVFRVISTRIPTLAELGIPESLSRFARLEHGLVLVTGPTGSGKSTTLAAIIDQINSERSGHILTIEDPIEYVHENRRCLVTQREVGTSARSFAAALRVAIRQDPDVILVGEMRDLETISLTLTAAETGALVFGTVHTSSAAKTVDRIVDVFPEAEQEMARALLASTLKGIVSQRLVPTSDGRGRACAIEIANVNFGLANLIREGKTFQITSAIQAGKSEGMQTLEQALAGLVEQGRITREVAYGAAVNKEYVATLVGMPKAP